MGLKEWQQRMREAKSKREGEFKGEDKVVKL